MRPGRAHYNRWAAVAVALLATTSGCNYSFVAGAGLPEHVETLAIVPFDNETDRFELTQEVHEVVLRELPRSLGLNLAGEDIADAIVRGSISNYNVDAPLYRSGQQDQNVQVLQRKVRFSARVEILDREAEEELIPQIQVTAEGLYLDASETEDVGRREAIERLVEEIVNEIQSNW